LQTTDDYVVVPTTLTDSAQLFVCYVPKELLAQNRDVPFLTMPGKLTLRQQVFTDTVNVGVKYQYYADMTAAKKEEFRESTARVLEKAANKETGSIVVTGIASGGGVRARGRSLAAGDSIVVTFEYTGDEAELAGANTAFKSTAVLQAIADGVVEALKSPAFGVTVSESTVRATAGVGQVTKKGTTTNTDLRVESGSSMGPTVLMSGLIAAVLVVLYN
jgi:hypothetical protein